MHIERVLSFAANLVKMKTPHPISVTTLHQELLLPSCIGGEVTVSDTGLEQ